MATGARPLTSTNQNPVYVEISRQQTADGIHAMCPSVLVGNALSWLLVGGDILEFDLIRQSLVVIERPAVPQESRLRFQILRTQESRLGFAILTKMGMVIFERKVNSEGVARWVLQKTVELDKLLQLGSSMDGRQCILFGFDEDTNVIFHYGYWYPHGLT